MYKVPLIVNDTVALPPSLPLAVPLPPDPPAPVTSSSIFTTPVPASANDLLILPAVVSSSSYTSITSPGVYVIISCNPMTVVSSTTNA